MTIDPTHLSVRPLLTPAVSTQEAQRPVGRAKKAGQAPSLEAPAGAKLFPGAKSLDGVRRVGDGKTAAPAQLQLHGAALGGVQALQRPSAVAEVGQARPLALPSPLRVAFDGVAGPVVRAGARLLEHNVEAWLAMWKVLGQPGPVDASYFILQRDVFGMAFLGQLYRKAKAGDDVRLMLDAAGDSLGKRGFTLSFRGQDYLQELQGTGKVQVKVYHPIHKKVARNLMGGLRPFGGVANNHDKLLISPTMAVTGGRNISKDYFTDPADRGDVYRDTDVLLEGAAIAREMKKAFDAEFEQDGLHFQVYGDTFGNWRKRDLELAGAALMMDAWLNAPPFTDAEKVRLREDKGARKAMAEQLLQDLMPRLAADGHDRAPGALSRMGLTRMARELAGYPELRGANRGFDHRAEMHQGVEMKVLDRVSAAVADGPDEFGKALAALAEKAQREIFIQNPYVMMTKGALEALKAAGERGVKIHLLTNSPDSSDSVITQAFFLEDWPKLLAAIPNLRIYACTGEQKLHAKTAMADDQLSLVSSYNLDLLSEQVNGEIGVLTWSEALAKDLHRSFEADLASPLHRVKEYTIARDGAGRPALKDGQPVVTFGPEDHVSVGKMGLYSMLRWVTRQLRKLPALEALRHPALEAPKGASRS